MNGTENETDMGWHLDAALVERYRDDRLHAAAAFSVEAHLVGCADCRELVTSHVPASRLATVWGDLVDVLDVPNPTPAERLLRRLGVRQEVARLLAGVPALTVSWLSGVAFVLGFAVLAAHLRPVGTAFFLIVAAVLPLAGVATAYGPGLDPMHEVGVAAPFRATRLLLVRALAVLSVSTLTSVLAALALPVLSWAVAAWIVPSLALTLLAVAAGTFGAPARSAASVAIGWLGLAIGAGIASGGVLSLFGEAGQLVAGGVAALSAAVLFARRDRIELAEEPAVPGWSR